MMARRRAAVISGVVGLAVVGAGVAHAQMGGDTLVAEPGAPRTTIARSEAPEAGRTATPEQSSVGTPTATSQRSEAARKRAERRKRTSATPTPSRTSAESPSPTATRTSSAPQPSASSSAPQPARSSSSSSASTGSGGATTSTQTGGQMGAANQYDGWTMQWSDDFDAPLDTGTWEVYGWGEQAPSDGAMGLYKLDNTYTANGALNMRIQYRDGGWTSSGLSTDPGHWAKQGRWEVRAKFPRGKGLGYAFLLWPKERGVWPPEIDFLEGNVNGPKVMGAYHYTPGHQRELRYTEVPDMTQWHTYGVIVETDRLVYTIDGEPWAEVNKPGIGNTDMRLSLQNGAMDPHGSAREYSETVPNSVPNDQTPSTSVIEIDWAAHYTRS